MGIKPLSKSKAFDNAAAQVIVGGGMTDVHRHLQSVLGFMELRMFDDANDEIEALPAALKTSREILGLRVSIYCEAGSWELMREVAAFLAAKWPEESSHWISLGFATRRCRSILEAEAILLEAVPLHPSEPMLHFNLSCYAAQTGRLGEARERLAQAITLDPSTKLLALDDPDLAPLWDEIGGPT